MSFDYDKFYGLENKVNIENIKRKSDRRLFEYDQHSRSRTFGLLSSVLNSAGSIWNNISENRDLMDYAESKGYEPVGSTFSKLFGSPKFKKGDEIYSVDLIRAMQLYEDYNKRQNILNLIGIDEPILLDREGGMDA